MRGMTLDKLLLPQSSRFFALQVILGSLVSALVHFLSLKAHNSVNFQPICKILVSKKSLLNLRDRVYLLMSLFILSLFFTFNQTSNNFLRHPVGFTSCLKLYNVTKINFL